MRQTTLDKIIKEHSIWLIDSSKGKRANLSRADLSNNDLRCADLRWADLRWANLRWADLNGADLSSTDLNGTDLRWADLNGADLSDTDLRWADLRWADLNGTDLRWTDLNGADLSNTDLSNTNLSRAKGIDYFKAYKVYKSYILKQTNSKPIARMGCRVRTIQEWEADFWSNNREFPNDGNKDSVARLNCFNKMVSNYGKFALKDSK